MEGFNKIVVLIFSNVVFYNHNDMVIFSHYNHKNIIMFNLNMGPSLLLSAYAGLWDT